MTAAVYVVGGSNRTHEELRFSLRSLVNVPAIDEVWILGHVPDWVQGVREVRTVPLPEKFANQRQSMEAFLAHPDTPAEFYLFNEDHYIVEPVGGPLPAFHLGDGLAYIEGVWRPKNTWCRAVRNTVEWLNDRFGRVLGYETHTPLLFDRDALADVLAEYPSDRSLTLGSLYPAAGCGGEGVNAGNAKVGADDSLSVKLSQDMPFLSGNQASFDGALGVFLKEAFPEPSKFER